jgi:class 3 adenylate cyclase/tetratricopeptide (TPR) repeat protein
MKQERKVVTALFCDLVGFTARAETLDPEDVAALLAPYQARLKDELERYGGTVEKFIGDAVMALFGAPVAHEDDPERAVRAALQIRDFAEAEQIRVRIGVATGEALVSLDAHPEQGETMATGDVINTAARIQAAAPVNGVLVGEATYRATERAIEYGDMDRIDARGKLERVRVWQALAPRARFGVGVFQTGRAPLVGRERERALLEAALSRARAERQPQLVTLVGAPGVGKSRLIYELWRIVDADPELIAWRQGRSLPYGQGIAFWALSEIVKAQAGILETETADEAAERLGAAVRALVPSEDVAWVERSLRPLVGLAGESDQSEERHAMTFAAWRRFFEALAEQGPAVVVFEDLQWADDGLLDFIDQLVDHVSGVPLIVVCSARPELLERRPGWGGGKREAMTISLAPLSDADTSRLIAALLEQPLIPADHQAVLLQRAGGNPLFAEEYVRMLVDRDVTSGEVPETLQGLVAARIDALPADEKEVLQQAAVLGKVFWTDAIGALSQLEARQLDAKLHALERKEFVRREHPSAVAGARQYVFVHVLVRDGAYGQMPRGVRAQAHRQVAEWIESLPVDRAGDRAEMLTHHLVQAIEYGRAAGLDVTPLIPRAAAALRTAGDRAWALGAPASALGFYERSMALEPGGTEDPHLLLRLGRALASVRAEGEPELARAAAALRETDPATAAEAELLRGEIIWQHGDQQRAFPYFERAAAEVGDLPLSRQKAFVVSQVARFLVLAGRAREGRALADDAIGMARELDDTTLLADVLTTRGIGRANSAEEGWQDDLERSLALNLEVKSWRAGRAYINLASTLFLIAGNLERAERLMREALQFAQGLGIDVAVRWCSANLAECTYHAGRWDEALTLAEREIGNPEPHYMQPNCHRHRALIRLARGDVPGALADIDSSSERSRLIRDPQDVIPALAWRAFCLARTGDRAGATAALEELDALGAWVERWGPSSVLRALGLHELGRAKDVGLEEHAGPATPWQQAAVAIGSGELDLAADRLAAIGARAFEADTRLQAARRHREAGRLADADSQLERALAFYREVRATAAIQEGEALLAAAS